MTHSKKLLFLGLTCSVLLLAGCGNDTKTYADDSAATYKVSNFVAQNRATVMVSNGENENDSDGVVDIESSNKALLNEAKATEEASLSDDEYSKARGRTHYLLTAASKLAQRQLEAKANGVEAKTNTTYTDMDEGDQVDLKVYSDLNKLQTVTFEKLHANADTDSVIVLAEVNGDGTTVIDKNKALDIDELFGTANPDDPDDTAIGTKVRSIFGSEWKTNPAGGIDGTDKVIIVACSDNTIGSGVYGYFNPSDESSVSESSDSNEGEILYINVDCSDYDRYSTIAHEFQHMCNYNQKVIRNGAWNGSDELFTMNEGQSVLSEDLCGFGPNGTTCGSRFILQVCNGYLAQPQAYSFTKSSSSACYGYGYLFNRYIADKYGVTTTSKIATSQNVGISNVATVVGKDFSDLLRNFGLAVLRDPMSGSTDYYFSSLDIDSDYVVYDEDGKKVTSHLNGVSCFDGDAMDGLDMPSWANAYALYANGTGNDLKINLWLPTFGVSNLVVETSKGVFEYMD